MFGGWKLIQESVASKFIGESLVLHLFASTIFSRNSLEAIMIHFMRKWHVSTLFPKEQSLNGMKYSRFPAECILLFVLFGFF